MPQTRSTEPLASSLARAREGDAGALGALVERFQEPLLARVRLMLGEEARRCAESVDFVQGAILDALRQGAPIPCDDERGLLRWMTAAARNDIRNAATRRREQALSSLSASLSLESIPDRGTPSPPSAAELDEEHLRLVEALEQLDQDQRRAIELRDLDGLSFAEVGRCMERSEAAAQMLHARALLRLGKALRHG